MRNVRAQPAVGNGAGQLRGGKICQPCARAGETCGRERGIEGITRKAGLRPAEVEQAVIGVPSHRVVVGSITHRDTRAGGGASHNLESLVAQRSASDLDTARHPAVTDWLAANPLPASRVHRTRSGGEHWFFLHDSRLRNWIGKPLVGIDIRAEGSGVVWWPAAGYPVIDRVVVAWPEGLVVALIGERSSEVPSLKGTDCHLQLIGQLPPPSTIRKEVAICSFLRKTAARWSREETFALYALNNSMNELMRTVVGQRNYVLNAKAYALGRLVVRGWVGGDAVVLALGYGAECCGHVQDHGEAATIAVIRAGLLAGMGRPYPDLDGNGEREVG